MIVSRVGKYVKWEADPDKGERIILPQSWAEKPEMVEIVADYGILVPVNRIFRFISKVDNPDFGEMSWFDERGKKEKSFYTRENALTARIWGNDNIVSEQSKRHNIFLLFQRNPFLLENIPRGGYDEIWGDYDEIDFAKLNERVI